MKNMLTLAAISTTVLLTACANPPAPGAGAATAAKANEHEAHHPARAVPVTAPATAAPSAMQDHMKAMQAMRDRMMNAKTPAERQALMEEHMKTMHEGMAMMKGMKNQKGMEGMGHMQGKGAMPGVGGMKGMPMDMASHHQMMEMRMEMMQTMMEMMMQRMPGAAMPPAGK